MIKVSKRVIKKADLDALTGDIQYTENVLSEMSNDVINLANKIADLESQRNEYPSETTAAFTRFAASISDIGGRLTRIYNRL